MKLVAQIELTLLVPWSEKSPQTLTVMTSTFDFRSSNKLMKVKHIATLHIHTQFSVYVTEKNAIIYVFKYEKRMEKRLQWLLVTLNFIIRSPNTN